MLFCVINNPKSNNLFLIIEKHQNLVFEELEPAKEVQKKKEYWGIKVVCTCVIVAPQLRFLSHFIVLFVTMTKARVPCSVDCVLTNHRFNLGLFMSLSCFPKTFFDIKRTLSLFLAHWST